MNALRPVSKFVAAQNLPANERNSKRHRAAAFLPFGLEASYCLIVVWAISFCLVGCSLVSPPKGITPRSFVLTPISGPSPTGRTSSTNIVVGIHAVKMPGYLLGKAFAMRRENNEIVYLESADWAERLDTTFQRALATDLARLIPTDQVRLSRWGAEAVAVEVDVNVDRFDVDSRGEGSLVAWWRLMSPGGGKILASGKFSTTRKGPPPDKDPLGASALMSHLASDLAETLARAIKEPNNSGDALR
jgi:uncharacterized lipoprotein YmbA